MPGLNKQGPEGNGPMSGRQQGMCRRTDELSLRGRKDGQGRGMGGRCRGSFPDIAGGQGQMKQSTANEELQAKTDELSALKSEYKKTQTMLETLMQKIDAMEGKKDPADNA
ncbi:DUF5320 domain-containing protein [Desulforhopalus sp. 52FAK]